MEQKKCDIINLALETKITASIAFKGAARAAGKCGNVFSVTYQGYKEQTFHFIQSKSVKCISLTQGHININTESHCKTYELQYLEVCFQHRAS